MDTGSVDLQLGPMDTHRPSARSRDHRRTPLGERHRNGGPASRHQTRLRRIRTEAACEQTPHPASSPLRTSATAISSEPRSLRAGRAFDRAAPVLRLRRDREAHRPVRSSPRRLVSPGSAEAPGEAGPARGAKAHTHHPDPTLETGAAAGSRRVSDPGEGFSPTWPGRPTACMKRRELRSPATRNCDHFPAGSRGRPHDSGQKL